MKLEAFNHSERDAAVALIRPCLDIRRWVDAIVAARPYPDLATLLREAARVAQPFTTAEIDAALAHHPRIGEHARGHDAQAGFSAAEQAGLGAGTAELDRALNEANRTYERRFGRVFLIRAAGRDRAGILAELHRRMLNDEATELQVIANQLREIAQGRLEHLVES